MTRITDLIVNNRIGLIISEPERKAMAWWRGLSISNKKNVLDSSMNTTRRKKLFGNVAVSKKTITTIFLNWLEV